MVVLDTNVLSELSSERPDPEVAAWFLRQPAQELTTTTICYAEVLFGLELLPQGRRRTKLAELLLEIFETALRGRRLPFDDRSAREYAILLAQKRRAGRPMPELDAQIAAIAVSAGASLATRNTADFEGCGISLVNPWLVRS